MKSKKNPIGFDELVEEINNQFDDIAEIRADHPSLFTGSPNELYIVVVKGEAEIPYGELTVPRNDIVPESEVVIDTGDGDKLQVPFSVRESIKGPRGQNTLEMTTIFLADDVLGAKELSLEEGMARLRAKMDSTCPGCRNKMEMQELRDHLRTLHTPEGCQGLSD